MIHKGVCSRQFITWPFRSTPREAPETLLSLDVASTCPPIPRPSSTLWFHYFKTMTEEARVLQSLISQLVPWMPGSLPAGWHPAWWFLGLWGE